MRCEFYWFADNQSIKISALCNQSQAMTTPVNLVGDAVDAVDHTDNLVRQALALITGKRGSCKQEKVRNES